MHARWESGAERRVVTFLGDASQQRVAFKLEIILAHTWLSTVFTWPYTSSKLVIPLRESEMSEKRRAEIEAKRAKLAELRKARADRQKAEADRRLSEVRLL